MAGDWIKIDAVLCDKPEVWRLAEITGLDPDMIVGKLVRLWSWMDQHLVSGDAVNVTSKQIDAVCRHEQFSTALASVGWLVIHRRTGAITVPNWDRHNGKSAKNRALGRERMAHKRNADSVTKSSPEKRREEKRKEEEKKKPRPALPPAAERRHGAPRLEAGAPTPSAGEAEKNQPVRSPAERANGLSQIGNLVRRLVPVTEAEIPDEVRAELERRKPIPLPGEEDAKDEEDEDKPEVAHG